jgi:hypothetical protein
MINPNHSAALLLLPSTLLAADQSAFLNRGGLLTQASFLTASANGVDTSPVVRGVYVQQKLLGYAPPPPPPDVPLIEPDASGATTIREQLTMHRE